MWFFKGVNKKKHDLNQSDQQKMIHSDIINVDSAKNNADYKSSNLSAQNAKRT